MKPAEVIATPYGRTGSTTLTTVPHTGEAPNTFPAAFTEIAASTDVDAAGLWVHFRPLGSTQNYQLKLFVGAAAAETEFCHLTGPCNAGESTDFFVPIPVAAGTRITAKSASSGGFQSARIGITLVRGTVGLGMQCSRGTIVGMTAGALTEVDCGAVADTKSAWIQLVASTARDAKAYTLCITGDLGATVLALFYVDIGVGAAASEVEILQNYSLFTAAYAPQARIRGPIWTPIPAGTRIAARAQCSTAAADARIPTVGLILWE